MLKAICWWFGCSPDLDRANSNAIPCSRCGAQDTSYEDRAGLTRHAIFVAKLSATFLPRSKCNDCGKRYGDHSTCLPF